MAWKDEEVFPAAVPIQEQDVRRWIGEARKAGAKEEHARLRPLMERCLEVVSQDYRHPTLEADLLRELGKGT